jgi:hypothetical protein
MSVKGSYEADDLDPNELYDQFPRGDEHGFGPAEGYNAWVRLNDPALFTEEARRDPVIDAFLNAPYSVNFGRFKSSHRETEYLIHKPADAMTGRVEGIQGRVDGMPVPDVDALPGEPNIATLIINHERSLAKRITHSIVVEDGKLAGQLIYKETEEPTG